MKSYFILMQSPEPMVKIGRSNNPQSRLNYRLQEREWVAVVDFDHSKGIKYVVILPSERNNISERESWEQEADAMRERKGYMTENERRQLREQALNEIKADRSIKEDFITEPLVESKENEILRRK